MVRLLHFVRNDRTVRNDRAVRNDRTVRHDGAVRNDRVVLREKIIPPAYPDRSDESSLFPGGRWFDFIFNRHLAFGVDDDEIVSG